MLTPPLEFRVKEQPHQCSCKVFQIVSPPRWSVGPERRERGEQQRRRRTCHGGQLRKLDAFLPPRRVASQFDSSLVLFLEPQLLRVIEVVEVGGPHFARRVWVAEDGKGHLLGEGVLAGLGEAPGRHGKHGG